MRNVETSQKLTKIPRLFNHTGLDGAGKGTQIEILMERLRVLNIDPFLSKAYGPDEKMKWGATVNRLLKGGTMGNFAVTLLFQYFNKRQTSRALEESAKGRIVIADRWDEGFVAYNREYAPLSHMPKLRNALLGQAFGGTIPQETIFYDLPVSAAQTRMNNRGALDGFDAKPSDHHAVMRNAYLQIGNERSWKIIDANNEIEEISKEVWHILYPLLFAE